MRKHGLDHIAGSWQGGEPILKRTVEISAGLGSYMIKKNVRAPETEKTSAANQVPQGVGDPTERTKVQ
jgi:hypothetical protein